MIVIKCLKVKEIVLGLEELAPMDSVMIVLQHLLNLMSSKIDLLKPSVPSEMDANHLLALRWTEWNMVLIYSSNLCDLNQILELICDGVNFLESLWEVTIVNKVLSLDFISS